MTAMHAAPLPTGTKAKKQHYVPQFLLRNFSSDGRHMGMTLLATGKRVAKATIKDQCQDRYFYGEDQVVEKEFSLREGRVAGILGDLSVERLENLQRTDLAELVLFAYYQRARTLGSVESIQASTNALARSMLQTSCLLNQGFLPTDEEVAYFKLKDENALERSLRIAAEGKYLFNDLALKFLVTDRTPGFVISDHPVTLNNQYVEHHADLQHLLGITGLMAKGLQAFLPISPSMTVALYDPSAYTYGGSSRICRAGPSDVAFLNNMQAANAFTGIYYDESRITVDAHASWLRAREQGTAYSKKVVTSPLRTQADGNLGQFVVLNGGEIRMGAKFSFAKHNDNFSYQGYPYACAPMRTAEMWDRFLGRAPSSRPF